MPEIRKGTFLNNRFEVHEYVGGGGFASVWQAYDTKLKRNVAIKRLLSESAFDPTKRDDVVAEARKIAALSDPHVVAIFDVIDHEDELLIIMEYLSGGTLQDYLRLLSYNGNWIAFPEIFSLLTEVLSGLKAAHNADQGPIIHRDLKPLNILFDRSGRSKIADFGLAATGFVEEIETVHPGKWEHAGTFGYKSPEQLKGAQLDPRSDIFNVGLIAYLLFAAIHPFTDPRFLFEYKDMVLEPYRTLPRIKPDHLPEDLEEFILTLLANDPGDRFQTASEALAELERIEEKYNETLLDRVIQYNDSLKTGSQIEESLTAEETAKGISLCKRKGFYIQGAFLYEKSGIDFSLLRSQAMAALEDDYLICRRRAGQEVSPE